MKTAVILLNLGGPDSPEAVEPFLRNLFGDPAILSIPGLIRWPLSRFLASRRAPVAREIYAKIGGSSPIVPQTQAQARALDELLASRGVEAKSFIAMRYWKPFAETALREAVAWGVERFVLLPLYPQFSTTTTASSLKDWNEVTARAGVNLPSSAICCFPQKAEFIEASARLIQIALKDPIPGIKYRLLMSAHGLPERTVARGDPYPFQVERTAQAIVDRLGIEGLDWSVCYQSRVGPLKWIGPATDDEIRRAGADGCGLVVAPVAFVSEHSETLVELDIEYAHLAKASGVRDYRRVPTVGTHPDFIAALADLVLQALKGPAIVGGADGRLCPGTCTTCPYPEAARC